MPVTTRSLDSQTRPERDRELVSRLVLEWTDPPDPPSSVAPEIVEKLNSDGHPCEIYVSWVRWELVDHQRRSDIIMEAYRQLDRDPGSLSVVMGLTPGEAKRMPDVFPQPAEPEVAPLGLGERASELPSEDVRVWVARFHVPERPTRVGFPFSLEWHEQMDGPYLVRVLKLSAFDSDQCLQEFTVGQRSITHGEKEELLTEEGRVPNTAAFDAHLLRRMVNYLLKEMRITTTKRGSMARELLQFLATQELAAGIQILKIKSKESSSEVEQSGSSPGS